MFTIILHHIEMMPDTFKLPTKTYFEGNGVLEFDFQYERITFTFTPTNPMQIAQNAIKFHMLLTITSMPVLVQLENGDFQMRHWID